MKRREKYAIGQHDLACADLGVGKSPDDSGPSLHEAVCDLRDKAATSVPLCEVKLLQFRFQQVLKAHERTRDEMAILERLIANLVMKHGPKKES